MSSQGRSRLGPSRTTALGKGSTGTKQFFIRWALTGGVRWRLYSGAAQFIELLRCLEKVSNQKIDRGTTLDGHVWSADLSDGNPLARPATQHSPAPEQTRLHPYGDNHVGFGHWRQRDDLYLDQGGSSGLFARH